jgi:hypothetical protein
VRAPRTQPGESCSTPGFDLARFLRLRSVRSICLCLLTCLVVTSRAEGKCGSEIKILLEPSELRSVLDAFPAERESSASVYFFDTNSLKLLSAGLILRVRRGEDSNITVKLRLPAGLGGNEEDEAIHGSKCEVDIVGDLAARSNSIQSRFTGDPPATGQGFLALLNSSQKHLLEQAGVPNNWADIRRFGGIKSTTWNMKKYPPYPKLTLELWKWPSGTVLEISAKVDGNSGQAAYEQLRQLVLSKGLTMKSSQIPKTTLALQDIVRTSASVGAQAAPPTQP